MHSEDIRKLKSIEGDKIERIHYSPPLDTITIFTEGNEAIVIGDRSWDNLDTLGLVSPEGLSRREREQAGFNEVDEMILKEKLISFLEDFLTLIEEHPHIDINVTSSKSFQVYAMKKGVRPKFATAFTDDIEYKWQIKKELERLKGE